MDSWIHEIEEFCRTYNVPIEYLARVLYEPKVVPMIRGKAFEFTVMLALQEILSSTIFEVKKVPLNAQLNYHDEDVAIIDPASNTIINVECKLAAKGKYRVFTGGRSEIRVKCMRSRTLGPKMVDRLAYEWGVDRDQLGVHNDQYLPTNFDIVVASIGNAF